MYAHVLRLLVQDLACHISNLARFVTSSMLILHIMVDMFHLWNRILRDHGWESVKGSYTVASSKPTGYTAPTCTHAHSSMHEYALKPCPVITSP